MWILWVLHEVGRLAEASPTLVADVWPLPGVDALVLDELELRKKALPHSLHFPEGPPSGCGSSGAQ